MVESEAARAKAMAAVTAMFDRYKLLASRRPKDHIVKYDTRRLWHATNDIQDFDREVMENLKLVDAGLDGSTTFELHMAPSMSNLNGTFLRRRC